MAGSRKTKKSDPPQVFLDFQEACHDSFGFLEGLGLEREPLEIHGYEGSILYRSPAVSLRVLYEPGGGAPWVQIATQVGETLEQVDLHAVIAERCPERALPPARGLLSDAEVRERLQHFAEALKDCGQDLLRKGS